MPPPPVDPVKELSKGHAITTTPSPKVLPPKPKKSVLGRIIGGWF